MSIYIYICLYMAHCNIMPRMILHRTLAGCCAMLRYAILYSTWVGVGAAPPPLRQRWVIPPHITGLWPQALGFRGRLQ